MNEVEILFLKKLKQQKWSKEILYQKTIIKLFLQQTIQIRCPIRKEG